MLLTAVPCLDNKEYATLSCYLTYSSIYFVVYFYVIQADYLSSDLNLIAVKSTGTARLRNGRLVRRKEVSMSRKEQSDESTEDE